jgi:hypothetical protein
VESAGLLTQALEPDGHSWLLRISNRAPTTILSYGASQCARADGLGCAPRLIPDNPRPCVSTFELRHSLDVISRPLRSPGIRTVQDTSNSAPTTFFLYRYLMGAMQQNVLAQTVRLMCIADDVTRLPEITQAWRAASNRMTLLSESESGLPDRIIAIEPPPAINDRLQQIAADPLFQASFSAMRTTCMIVDIDHLVAPQREVNLDYVEDLRTRIPGTTVSEVLEFCVGPRSITPELRALQTAGNQVTYTSRSLDLRFLGGFPKVISGSDIAVAHSGGQPVEAIALLVGFGAAPINVFKVGNRIVLNNGFHRVVALRFEGIMRIPVVVQHVSNAQIEFPEQLLNLTRAYLLEDPRPVLIKDFFDGLLTVELRLKPRRKVLSVRWGEESSVVPE